MVLKTEYASMECNCHVSSTIYDERGQNQMKLYFERHQKPFESVCESKTFEWLICDESQSNSISHILSETK